MQIWSGIEISLWTLYGACACTWKDATPEIISKLLCADSLNETAPVIFTAPASPSSIHPSTGPETNGDDMFFQSTSYKSPNLNKFDFKKNLTLGGSPIVCGSDRKKGCGSDSAHSCGCVNACAGCRGRSRRTEMICPESAFPSTSSGLVLKHKHNSD